MDRTVALHPSHIKLKENHCGYAVELSLNHATRDREVFQVGIAAHAVLENIGIATNDNPEITALDIKQIANNTAYELCTNGRSYDGHPEPPMKMSQAIEGMKLALAYAEKNPLPHDASYEEPFAFDKEWNPVGYDDSEAVFRTLLDFVHIVDEMDEDGHIIKTAIVRDYKSSWYITSEMLDNLQRRAQALVVYLKYKPDVLKMQIHGLRGGQKIERIIFTQYQHDELMNWRDDIAIAIKSLQAPQNPTPGTGCYQCPYVAVCSHANYEDKKKIAEKYAIAIGVAKELEKKLRLMTKEHPIETENGTIGYIKKERNTTAPNAMESLYEVWIENNGTPEGFINLLKLTATDAKKIIKALQKNGLDRDTLTELTMTKQSYSQFSIQKK